VIVTYYNFTAGHRYKFIAAMEGIHKECSGNRYTINGPCTTLPAPVDSILFDGEFYFSNGSHVYNCLESGTAVYSVNYFTLQAGQKYSVAINDLSV
jgi:hypothetical protein